MENLSTIGRYTFAVPLIVFGLFHFINATDMAGMVPSFLPFAAVWVYLSGIALIAPALGILLKKYVRESGLIIAGLMLLFILFVHAPGLFSTPMNMMALPMILKDLMIAAGGLLISAHAGIYERKG